jgi:hypothetical protein
MANLRFELSWNSRDSWLDPLSAACADSLHQESLQQGFSTNDCGQEQGLTGDLCATDNRWGLLLARIVGALGGQSLLAENE